MDSKAKQRLAKLIKSRREELGISQRVMARSLNVTQAAISKWELADPRSTIGIENLEKIAELCDWSMEELWAYLERGDVSRDRDSIPVEEIIRAIKQMPASDVAKIVSLGAQKLAQVN